MDLTKDQFDWIRSYVLDATAIVLDEGKEYLVRSRIEEVLKAYELDSIEQLIKELSGPRRLRLHGAVVDAMTTNETSFFRDMHPFEALQHEIIPQLIERRAHKRKLRIWCAASSSGQEPYSLAMLFADHFPQLASWDVEIVGTDISDAMLEKCRAGRFTQLEVARGLPTRMLVRFFTRDGTDWVAKPELSTRMRFTRLNLAEPWPNMDTFDLVLIRNVLIYFDLGTKQKIFERINRVLEPDGYLLLGAAETTTGIDPRFVRTKAGKASYYLKTA